MITTGVTGQVWRASITPWGAVEPWDETRPLNWFVAADDRWHAPADEQSVRQQRVDGTPVTETRLRVPTGDVVQRIHSVADGGGLTVVEIENESTMPVAVAFDRRDILTDRPIADVPIEGIELPTEAFVLPLGHHATVRVAIVHGRQRAGPIPSGIASTMPVVRGWLGLTERASRFVLPDGELGATLAEAVTAERCEIALGSIAGASDDAVAFVLALHELVRMGEDPGPWMPELVDAVEHLGPTRGWEADAALHAAHHVVTAAGERRARRDLARIVAGRSPAQRPTAVPDGVRAIAWLESGLVSGADLLPAGLPAAWLGQPVEVHGVPTVPGSAVSFALRWHGARPAALWEQTGEPTTLTASTLAPGWRSDEANGEALWPAPPGAELVIEPTEPPAKNEHDAPIAPDPECDPGSFS